MNTNISNIFLEQLSWLYAIFFSLSKTKKENRKWDKIKKKKHNPKSHITQALGRIFVEICTILTILLFFNDCSLPQKLTNKALRETNNLTVSWVILKVQNFKQG